MLTLLTRIIVSSGVAALALTANGGFAQSVQKGSAAGGNQKTVEQAGSPAWTGNVATQSQTGAGNTAWIRQEGAGDTAKQVQSGSHNKAGASGKAGTFVLPYGPNQHAGAEIWQTGDGNTARQVQSGNRNEANITQRSDGNVGRAAGFGGAVGTVALAYGAEQRQSGSHNLARIEQGGESAGGGGQCDADAPRGRHHGHHHGRGHHDHGKGHGHGHERHHHHHGGHGGNVALQLQASDHNVVVALQYGIDGASWQSQGGGGWHKAFIDQQAGGARNAAWQSQSGVRNDAAIEQGGRHRDGSDNQAQQLQTGSDNRAGASGRGGAWPAAAVAANDYAGAEIWQTGSRNTARQAQAGSHNEAFVAQDGDDAVAIASVDFGSLGFKSFAFGAAQVQDGGYSLAAIVQEAGGVGNAAYQLQAALATGSIASIVQRGTDGRAWQEQGGAGGHRALIDQGGAANRAIQVQGGSLNVAIIWQGGAGNVAQQRQH